MTLAARSALERALSSTRLKPRSLDRPMLDRRLVAYYRVSTPMQELRGLGLAGQRSAVERFAAKWRGTLVAEYTETESGRNCERNNLNRALGACRVYRATLLIAQIDRLARNLAFIAMLIESGTEFVAVDFPLANSFNKHILAAIAEHELKSMSDRRKAVCAVLKARGVDVARHLRGKSAPSPQALDKARAALLARDAARAVALAPLLRELRNRGLSVNAIIGKLRQMEIAAPKGGQTWSAGAIQRMFRLAGEAPPPRYGGGRRRPSKRKLETCGFT